MLQENGKKMPLKKNSPKWHETAKRRQGLWEQFFTIRSLLFCECWRCSTTGVRNLQKACSKNPSGSPGSLFTIAIIRLPGQLIQQIDCSLPKPLAAGLTELMQELWEAAACLEQLTTSLGGMRDLPAISVCRGTQGNAKLSTAFKMSLFCDHYSPFPDFRLAECFPVPCVLKNKLRSCVCFWLGVCSPWQPALSDRAIQVTTSQLVAPCTQKGISHLKGAHHRGGKKRNVCQCARGAGQLLEHILGNVFLFLFFFLA